MITIQELRAGKFRTALREISIGNELALCAIPPYLHEKSLTQFLRFAIDSAPGDAPDPMTWTVGERLMALAHYCTATREDGPDYQVTIQSKLSDYLRFDMHSSLSPAFNAAGDEWSLIPLTGASAEAIEALSGTGAAGRDHWLFGSMAAQLVRPGEEQPNPVQENSQYIDWLAARIEVFKGFPGSDFEALYSGFCNARAQSEQFFNTWFDDEGIIVLPKEAGADVPPTRFLVSACISAVALSITGKS